MARQATKLRAQRPPPGALICLAGAVGAAAAVTPDLSADSRGRSFEALCDPPYRPTGGNASRNLFALLKPQRYQSPPAWRWSNPSIASQDPIDAALVPPLKRPRDVRHTLTALPALPQLGLLFRREPCPCMPLHSRTSLSAKLSRCCVDSLTSPAKSGHSRCSKKQPLFNRLVGCKQKVRRNRQAERLGDFEVDHQLVLGRQLEGQIASLLAAQNAIHIGGRAAVRLNAIRTVGNQPAARHEDTLGIDRRQTMPRNRRDGLMHERDHGDVQGNKDAAIGLRRRRCHGALDVPKVVNVRDERLDTEWAGGRFKRTGITGP